MPCAVNIIKVDISGKQKKMRTKKVSKKVEVIGEKNFGKEKSSSNGKKKNLFNEEYTIEKHSEEKRTEKVHKQGEEV